MQQIGTSIPSNNATKEVFHERLRQLTAPQHKKLESHPLSKSLIQLSISLDGYADYLIAMSGIMKEYDSVILPYLSNIIPDTQIRRKSEAIGSDISWLEENGVSIRKNEIFRMPELNNHATAMGVAYVLEGSTLGGRIIIKHLQRFFPVTEIDGARFFAGYGNETGVRWKQFIDSLTNFAIKEKCENDIIAGAQVCFDSIYNHFDKSSRLNEV